MKTLHLNLKRKWFDMIFSGEKKEEYRDIKEHYVSLLFDWKVVQDWDRKAFVLEFKNYGNTSELLDMVKDFDTITFSNGYANDRPQFEIEFKGLEIREGKEKWGAEREVDYFVLKLGEIVKNNPTKLVIKDLPM